MKALLVISSWIGKNPEKTQAMRDAIRDTFLRDIGKFPGLDYKFFMGDGTPTGEDESFIMESLSQKCFDPGYKEKAIRLTNKETIPYAPREDEILLPVPDDYLHITYKMRAEHRWSLEHGYDFTFQSSGDIYIDLERVVKSGFHLYDYSGRPIPCAGLYRDVDQYAGGHAGYWLSKKASRIIANSPVDFWCDDIWVGQRMYLNTIPLRADLRYAAEQDPMPNNDTITAHLGDRGSGGTFGAFDPALMYEAHRTRNNPQVKITALPKLLPPRFRRTK
jgi:hypothetical protein